MAKVIGRGPITREECVETLGENDTPFSPHIVRCRSRRKRGVQEAALKEMWPIGKFPALRDEMAERTVPESSIIIEYLAQHYPGKTSLVPGDAELARQTHMRDREPMGKPVTDWLRPPGKGDPHGVEQAKALLLSLVSPLGLEPRTP